MLYLVSNCEEFSDEIIVYEASSAPKALELAADDGYGAGGELYAFEVKKASKRKFVKKTVWVAEKDK